MPDMRPGRLSPGEFVPPSDDEYGADAEAADQQSEIGMLGQGLKHETV
jgi:hypothetical protein